MTKTIFLDAETLDALAARGLDVDRASGEIRGELESKPRKATDMDKSVKLDGFDPSQVLHALALGELRREGGAENDADAYVAAANAVRRRHPELGTRPESDNILGQDLVDKARQLLASRNIHSPTYDELASALVEVA